METTKSSSKSFEIKKVHCKNCSASYVLKKGAPEICWICGMPVEEEINEI